MLSDTQLEIMSIKEQIKSLKGYIVALMGYCRRLQKQINHHKLNSFNSNGNTPSCDQNQKDVDSPCLKAINQPIQDMEFCEKTKDEIEKVRKVVFFCEAQVSEMTKKINNFFGDLDYDFAKPTLHYSSTEDGDNNFVENVMIEYFVAKEGS